MARRQPLFTKPRNTVLDFPCGGVGWKAAASSHCAPSKRETLRPTCKPAIDRCAPRVQRGGCHVTAIPSNERRQRMGRRHGWRVKDRRRRRKRVPVVNFRGSRAGEGQVLGHGCTSGLDESHWTRCAPGNPPAPLFACRQFRECFDQLIYGTVAVEFAEKISRDPLAIVEDCCGDGKRNASSFPAFYGILR